MFPNCQQHSFPSLIEIIKNIWPFPKSVPVPPILYTYTREKYIYHFLARVYFYIYKHVKNRWNAGNRERSKRKHIHFFNLRRLKFAQILLNTNAIRSKPGYSRLFCTFSVVCNDNIVPLCPCKERRGIKPAVPHLAVKNRFDNVDTGFF